MPREFFPFSQFDGKTKPMSIWRRIRIGKLTHYQLQRSHPTLLLVLQDSTLLRITRLQDTSPRRIADINSRDNDSGRHTAYHYLPSLVGFDVEYGVH